MKIISLTLLSLLPFGLLAQESFSLEDKVNSVLKNSVPLVRNQSVRDWSHAHLLDAREHHEYNVSHLPNAVYVGDKDFKLETVNGISKTDTIIVYCSVGYRSEGIAEKLKSAGYQNVFNLFGGIFAWKNGGGEVVNSKDEPTEKVHTYNQAWSIFLLKGEKVY